MNEQATMDIDIRIGIQRLLDWYRIDPWSCVDWLERIIRGDGRP